MYYYLLTEILKRETPHYCVYQNNQSKIYQN